MILVFYFISIYLRLVIASSLPSHIPQLKLKTVGLFLGCAIFSYVTHVLAHAVTYVQKCLSLYSLPRKFPIVFQDTTHLKPLLGNICLLFVPPEHFAPTSKDCNYLFAYSTGSCEFTEVGCYAIFFLISSGPNTVASGSGQKLKQRFVNDSPVYKIKGLLELITRNIESAYFVFLVGYVLRIWTKEK